jgi:hypothetical protein
MSTAPTSIRRRALRLEQTPDHPLYLFSLTGDELLQLADISRISRNDVGKLIGYQRPEVKKHVQDICNILVLYWTAVRQVFADAWGKPPDKSRLMHGAGIRAMGRLMDRILPSVNARDKKAAERVLGELKLVSPICRWTDGNWEAINGLKWNEVQNVPRHINILSNVLDRLSNTTDTTITRSRSSTRPSACPKSRATPNSAIESGRVKSTRKKRGNSNWPASRA